MPRSRAGLDEPLDAVGPIGAAAEQPRDDEPRLRDHARYRDRPRNCGRAADRREPQARRRRVVAPAPRLRRGEQRDLGVGAGQHDDVARRLGEIDRGRSVGDGAGLGRRADAFSQPPRAPRGSRRGRCPLRPITTSRRRARLAGRQARSKCCSMRSPTACTTCRRSRPGTSRKPLTRSTSWARISAARRARNAARRRPGRARRQSCRNRRGRARRRDRGTTGERRDRPRPRRRGRAPPPARRGPARRATSFTPGRSRAAMSRAQRGERGRARRDRSC